MMIKIVPSSPSLKISTMFLVFLIILLMPLLTVFADSHQYFSPFIIDTVNTSKSANAHIDKHNQLDLNELIQPSILTFFNSESSLQVDSTSVWPPFMSRSLYMKFRTDRPNGLLFFHIVDSAPQGYPVYEFYMMLERGNIKVIHEFGMASDIFTLGRSLNNDQWHEVNITITVERPQLMMIVDDQAPSIFDLKDFANRYPQRYKPYSDGIQSTIFFGGIYPKFRPAHQHHTIARFIGCMGNIIFEHETILFALPPEVRQSGLKKGCYNACASGTVCSLGAPCINHYTHATCDCFASESEDDWCSTKTLTSVTFRGSSFITYKAFNWTEGSEALFNRLSVHFKTIFDTSLLLYAYGLYPRFNQLNLALISGQIRFEIDFGEGPLRIAPDTVGLNDDQWHNVTILHSRQNVTLLLDGHAYPLIVTGIHHLHLEPFIYVGGLPASVGGKSNLSENIVKQKFVGCLRGVYFNRADIIYRLKRKSPSIRYTGLFQPEFGCSPVHSLPITLQTSWSYLNITKTRRKEELDVILEIKTNQTNVVMGSGVLQYGNNTDSRWILHLNNSMPQFSIILGSEEEKPQSMIVTEQDPSSSTYTLGQWNMISVEGYGGNLTLKVGDSYSIDLVYKEKIHFDPNIIIGALNSTFPNSTRFGLGIMGCIRNVNVDGRFIDPRVMMDDPSMHRGRISLDECTLVNPCNYPSACEHNGRCTVNRQGEAACDCTDTGYAGKTCHFALYKRTCEEYYLVGHRKNGTYTIDIDRNGPLPPANVDCTMSPHRKETTIRHNIPVEYIVRKLGLPDFYITVQYREFTKEMLKALISHTKGCSQEIKYGCKRAPFGLSGQTWMISATDRRVDSLGSDLSGRCPCSTAANCRNRDLHCNCDESSDLEGEDSGVISDPNRLGVHRVYFKQPPNLTLQSEGRFTLSPLKCLDLSTQEHNITFKTKDSFLQLDGWFKGDLAFSFRTTLAEGILLYQAPLFPHHGYFRVSIINEFEMLFEYSVNGVPRQSTVISHRKLNSGEWQQVWIDYETRHMRFTVNLDSFMIDLDVDQEFDPFEGPLYIGGAPKSKLTGSSLKGFTGCFRGLLIDDQIIPLRIPDTVKGVEVHCQESCRPNPCFNSGKCIEMWGNYECKCSNPLTQSGKRCEQDLNEKAITLASNDAYIHIRWTRQPIHHPVLQKDILMSFKTYEKKGLLLYSNDHLNNFVQIHINGTAVTLTFNTKRKVVSGSVDIGPELSKGELIQLQINRSPSKTILNVYTNCKVGCTNHSVIIEAPVSILSEYYQSPWTNGAHLELVRPFRYFLAVQPHTQLFIGGVHPAVNHSIPSFVGCISGLKIDDNVVNLPDLINQKRLDLTVSGNISRGCNRKCDQNPCENGGICREDLRINGTEGVFCDCMATSYRGKRCDSDVGLKFYGSSVLKYNLSSYSNVSLETFSIEFAFSAEPEFYPLLSGIKRLIFAFYYGNHTFTAALLASGGLQFLEEDKTGRGWKKVVQPIQSNLADGYRHWATYTRKQNLTILQIDGGQAMPLLPLDINSKTAKNKTERHYIKIGGSLDNPDDLKDFKTYIGCLSNLQVKFGKNLENIINPIDAAFDGDQNVDVISNGTTTEEGMNQRRCSKFKPVSKISSNSRNLILSSGLSEKKWSPSEPLRYQLLYATRPKGPMDIRSHEFYIAIVCVIFLGFVILFVAIYMFRIQRNYKLRKFHHDTPFFNSQRSFDRVYQEDRASSTAASLLKFQPDDSSRASELQILYSNGGDDSDYDSIPVSQRISSSIQLMEKHSPRRSK